ncbi:YraN family protein [Thermophilibacter provencensis]|uniref:UPF0102 protein QUW25_04580 n=1 Tax=Thermophilibacter provencensis TaxID=1852386 RepID=A0ABT7V2X7_9ACTN|nr:YraN family protein [Thermophilibacter provencensis]MDM8270949.1 YraN family protein [Thermophilibacter provencensis]
MESVFEATLSEPVEALEQERDPAPVAVNPPCAELSSHDLGKRGEDAAVRSLTDRGWQIIVRNWHCSEGEVDIIAKDPDGELVFVEVKTRHSPGAEQGLGYEVIPEEAVDEAKRARYVRCASLFLRSTPYIERVRFDVIAITVTGPGRAHLRHIGRAFEGDDL